MSRSQEWTSLRINPRRVLKCLFVFVRARGRARVCMYVHVTWLCGCCGCLVSSNRRVSGVASSRASETVLPHLLPTYHERARVSYHFLLCTVNGNWQWCGVVIGRLDVALHVQRQVVRTAEAAVTVATLEGFGSGVFAVMAGELVGAGEAPLATGPGTPIGFLTWNERKTFLDFFQQRRTG